MEENNQVSVDIEELAKSVNSELEKVQPLSKTCCIYRAPKRLWELNPKAYTPLLVSIGPFHYNKEELQPMQENKKRYLQFFLQRSETLVSVQDFLQVKVKNETRLRNCYSETINLSSEEFVKMILVDSAFVIEFLLRLDDDDDEEEDFLFNESCKYVDVGADLLLFENQIPFFILEELLNLYSLSLRKLALNFSNFTLHTTWEEDQLEKINFSQVKHLLDFLRICNKPTELHSTGRITPIPTVKELHQAGVKFRTRPGKSIFDIKFSNGILEIPPMFVHELTENLLRNLLASEQCPGVVDNFFNDYICFINLLANSPEDVEILLQNGIIDNRTFDREKISILFHNLARVFLVNDEDFYYSDLVKQLDEYRNRRRHKWKTILNEKYFSNPWSVISFIGAIIFLILNCLDTLFSILLTLQYNNATER